MHVETETLSGLRLATLRHLGPYQQIGRTFSRLHEIVTRAGLPHRELVGIYHDDPSVTPPLHRPRPGQARVLAGGVGDDRWRRRMNRTPAKDISALMRESAERAWSTWSETGSTRWT